MSTRNLRLQQITEAGSAAIDSLPDSRLKVVEPLSVEWNVEDGSVIADATEINEYGYGDTVAEAIEDLQATIVELYFHLDENRDQLGPDLEKVYGTLSTKLRKADALNGA